MYKASHGGRVAIATVVASLAVLVISGSATAATTTTDLNGQTATAVAQSLVGAGVTISNVTFTGDNRAGGTFAGGTGIVGFESGAILSSGDIAASAGPNDLDNTTTSYFGAGDSDLDGLAAPLTTQDATVLEFDFVPNADTVFFRYVFGSEEYNEYVNSSYNDVFGFFVNGVNCATVPDGVGGTLPVSINSINNGNPLGLGTITNPALFRNNDLSDGGGAIDTEMDGLTIVLTCMAPVNANVTNNMKLAIADTSDTILDSVVFIEQGSLSTTPPGGSGKVTGGGRIDFADGAVSFGTVVIQDEQGLRGNLQVNDHRTGDKFHGYAVDSLTVTDKTATWSGEGRWNGEDGYTFELTIVDNRNGNSANKGPADTIAVALRDNQGNVVWSTGGVQNLTRGNIVVHTT